MVELGTRCTTERVHVGHSPPTVARACALLDLDLRVCGTGIDCPCVVSPPCPGKQYCLAPGGVPHLVRPWLLGPHDGDAADYVRHLQRPKA